MQIDNEIKKLVNSLSRNIDFKSDLFAQLDSMQFLNLIIKLEKKFLIKINEKEINSHNFKNIKNIVQLINDKKK